MRATVLAAESNAAGEPKARWVSIKWRLVCIAATAVALFLVLRRIPAGTLLDTIRGMRVRWFVGAVVLYGIMFLPAAWRWHLALRINHGLVNPLATFRFTIIGHFFYLILFGGAGGDAAKAAVYARRYQLPMPKILAAAWLDRLMGFGALIVISAIGFLVTGLNGGFGGTKPFPMRGSAGWLLVAVPIIVLLLVLLKRSRRESIWHRIAKAFLEGGRRLLRSPKIVLSGFFCSLLMQVAINAVLALNLQAVSHAPIPWLQLLWTLPLITAISGLPVTIAGIGSRDGAAIALLGWCGVAAANAEAMALLTLCVSALWGLVGGLALWLESNTPAKNTRENF